MLHLPDDSRTPLRIRSLVGLIPLLAVETLEPEVLDRLPGFARGCDWFIEHRPDLTGNVACMRTPGHERAAAARDPRRRSAAARAASDARRERVPVAVRHPRRSRRSIATHPYALDVNGTTYRVAYEPAESSTGLFGGNSNWRGPIWFPINYLLIEALQKFHHYFGDDFTVECPTGSGQMMTLGEVAAELSRRLTRIFLRDDDGERPVFGGIDAVPARSALARPDAVPRVLPRRHRRRRRRQPPDRLDGARRQAASAERRTVLRWRES